MAIDLVPLSALLNRYHEEEIRRNFSFFKSINKDVEHFIHETCIQFEKIGLSRTTLVYVSFKGRQALAGYFAISSKSISISKKNWNKMSNNLHRKLMPMGYKDEKEDYLVSSILLGQLGLNFQYHDQKSKILTGDELLSLAYGEVVRARDVVGGVVVYVEVDNEPRLRDFYTRNGFSQVLLKMASDGGKVVPYETPNRQHLYIKKIKDID
ncbi:GNAT family acetyltransferase [Lacticaseibacillus paracasei]|uniref:GNAT family acetyltransferase n=1 Tax=Lacticaseibacillus paracasei TaxID=1597 RepID=UPI0021D39344|nr:GNAT family acetyltransferase [Lacticaseibacillus paracasei]MCU6430257.1 GNAT family acetyltransferase [Lacticaseibacillus paracasei]